MSFDEPEDMEWKSFGACRNYTPDWWFPTVENRYSPETHRAVEICRGCSVAQTCLAFAMTNEESDGIWGGRTPPERRAMAKVTVIRLRCRQCGQLSPVNRLCSCGTYTRTAARQRAYR